jgi:hypothetical protein
MRRARPALEVARVASSSTRFRPCRSRVDARVNHVVSLVGFAIASALGLYMLWKIARTPGEL